MSNTVLLVFGNIAAPPPPQVQMVGQDVVCTRIIYSDQLITWLAHNREVNNCFYCEYFKDCSCSTAVKLTFEL